MGQSKLKQKTFFVLCIPTYNSAKYLDRCFSSVFKQTFGDFVVLVTDDHSDDNSKEKIAEWLDKDNRMIFVKPRPTRMYNGGIRNHLVKYADEHFDYEYLLFLDSDDEYLNNDIFQGLHDFILEKNKPDMIRLPYRKHYDDSDFEKDIWFDDGNGNIEGVCWSKRVAPWTKVLKKGLFVEFPENTLFEDVCQHIHQCDVTNSVAHYDKPCVIWHIRESSISHSNSPKWKSSAWRFVADLMDLDLKKDTIKFRRDKKVEGAIRSLFDNRFEQ